MAKSKTKKTEEARKKKLYGAAAAVLLMYGSQHLMQYLDAQATNAARAPIFGNESTVVEISQLVSMREMPLFAAMATENSDRGGSINSAIFSSKTIEAPPPEPVAAPIVERPREPQKPDYLRHFNEQFIVTGTLIGGAVINNEFTPTGGLVNGALYTPLGEQQVKLMRVTPELLTILIDETLYNIAVR